jgi:ABC-type glycerol-3-phosphate transport system permease component
MISSYERRKERLASPEVFRRRLIRSGTVGMIMVVISLVVGMAGYAFFERLGWADAFLNAAMIVSGMGPMHVPATTGGKIFAGFYAIYSGFAVLVIAAVAFAPVIHRVMHRFHLEEEGKEDEGGRTGERPRPKFPRR